MMVVENARSLTYVDEPRLNDFQYETYGRTTFILLTRIFWAFLIPDHDRATVPVSPRGIYDTMRPAHPWKSRVY
jgi:hypothetical protein